MSTSLGITAITVVCLVTLAIGAFGFRLSRTTSDFYVASRMVTPAWNASGYGTVREMEQGLITREEAEERVVIETRQYAKRQRTWFRHQLAGEDVTRLDAGDTVLVDRLAAWWTGGPA